MPNLRVIAEFHNWVNGIGLKNPDEAWIDLEAFGVDENLYLLVRMHVRDGQVLLSDGSVVVITSQGTTRSRYAARAFPPFDSTHLSRKR